MEVINLLVSQMFADRSAVHLQKDLLDDGNGWLLNRRFIPEHYTVQWEMFKKQEQTNVMNLSGMSFQLKVSNLRCSRPRPRELKDPKSV